MSVHTLHTQIMTYTNVRVEKQQKYHNFTTCTCSRLSHTHVCVCTNYSLNYSVCEVCEVCEVCTDPVSHLQFPLFAQLLLLAHDFLHYVFLSVLSFFPVLLLFVSSLSLSYPPLTDCQRSLKNSSLFLSGLVRTSFQ